MALCNNDSTRISKFNALVNLTRLVAGQVLDRAKHTDEPVRISEQANSSEFNDVDSDSSEISENNELDALSIQTNAASIEDADYSRRRFLDRFAEVASPKKGALYVTSAAMLESEKKVELFVACNQPFDDRSRKFFDKLQTCLRNIAKSDGKDLSQNKEQLWEILLQHQQDRLRFYVENVEKGLQALFQYGSLTRLDQVCEESHRILEELSEQIKNEKQASWIDSHSMLSTMSLQARRSESVQNCLGRHKNGPKLLGHVCFLARVRAAYEEFIDAAARCPAFSYLIITPITLPGAQTQHHVLDLTQALRVLNFDSTLDNMILAWLSSRSSDFDYLQKAPRHMHAEVQTILYLANYGLMASVYPYLGGSRYCCFLCWEFLKAFSRFEARGCHHKLYPKWMLPEIHNVPEESRIILKQATERLQNTLCDIILNCRSGPANPPQAESSAGITRNLFSSQKQSSNDEWKAMWASHSTALQQRRQQTSVDEPLGRLILDDEDDDQHPVLSEQQALIRGSCIMCGASDAKRCTRCWSVEYCGKECQRRDWRLHRTMCSQLTSFLATRPSQNHRVAILLPEHEAIPTLIWVKCEMKHDEDYVSYEKANIRKLLGDDDVLPKSAPMNRNIRRGYNLNRTVEVRTSRYISGGWFGHE